jgi:hypothetical protein
MNFSFTSRTLLALGLVLSVPLLTGANGSGCGGNVIIGNNGGSSTITCGPSDCGEAAPDIAAICPDGTSVGPTCGVTSNGTCGWTFPCLTPACTTAQCGPVPAIAEVCPDGGSPSPVCVMGASGCGWTFPPCPTTPPCNASDCGPEPGLEQDCNGVPVGPTCETTATGNCGWVFPECVPPAQDAGICQWETNCPCADGTTQIASCSGPGNCTDACAAHGGSK